MFCYPAGFAVTRPCLRKKLWYRMLKTNLTQNKTVLELYVSHIFIFV